MVQEWVKRGVRTGTVFVLLVTAGAVDAAAQGRDRGWRSQWGVGLSSTFDHNPFRLSSGQREDFEDGDDRYESLSRPYDVVNRLRVGGEIRGRGIADKRLEVESEARVDVYTFNSRLNSVGIELAATQRLSKQDEVRLGVGLAPSEFRRNYLTVSTSGEPEFVPGVATTLEGGIAYQRRVLRGKRAAPDLDLTAGLIAGRRTFEGLPWRDRSELGAELEADLDAGRFGLEVRGVAARALDAYAGAEPILSRSTLVMAPIDRNFNEFRLGAETTFDMSKRTRLSAEYELRERRYTASLSEDPYVGDRRDRRHSIGGGVQREVGAVELLIGAKHQFQTTFRPGRGDTGDEADYQRFRIVLGLAYGR